MDLYSFYILFFLYVSLAIFYVKKDSNNLIQPHAFYTAQQFTLLLLIPFIQYYFTDLFEDRRGFVFFNSMIGLSYLFFSIGFFVKKERATEFLNLFIRRFNIKRIPNTVFRVHVLILMFVATLVFVLLAERSGFGLLAWLRYPRTGYQEYRRGLGHLYVISLAIFSFIYLLILYFSPNNTRKLLLNTAIFIFIFYFYGSKGMIVFTIFQAVVFYNFFVRRIKFKTAMTLFAGLILIFTLSFSVYRAKESTTSLFTEMLTYAGYYNEGRRFFANVDEGFEHLNGEEYINGLWMYVPRAIYPDKPYSYGIVKYVVEHYYPGAGESGNTPAFGGPVEEYLNFGIIGVIIFGFLRGYVSSLFYNYFLKYKNFVGFVLLSNEMGFSIFPVMEWPIYKVLWYVLNIVLLSFHKQIMTVASVRSKRL